ALVRSFPGQEPTLEQLWKQPRLFRQSSGDSTSSGSSSRSSSSQPAVGIHNPSNLCWMISLSQSLLYIPSVYEMAEAECAQREQELRGLSASSGSNFQQRTPEDNEKLRQWCPFFRAVAGSGGRGQSNNNLSIYNRQQGVEALLYYVMRKANWHELRGRHDWNQQDPTEGMNKLVDYVLPEHFQNLFKVEIKEEFFAIDQQENPIPGQSKEKKDDAGNAWWPHSQLMFEYNEQKHTDILGALRNAHFDPDKGDSSIYSHEMEPHDPRPAWLEGMEMRTKQVPAEVRTITDSHGRTRTIRKIMYGLHRKAHLRRLPEILRLEVKRFAYEMDGSIRKKKHYLDVPRLFYIDGEARRNGPSGVHTEFERARLRNPESQEDTHKYTEWARQTQGRGMDPVSQAYELHAVILHHGHTANSGHYTAVVNVGTQRDPQWRHFDDDKSVRAVPNSGFDQYLKDQSTQRDSTVYMLLYKKPNAQNEQKTREGRAAELKSVLEQKVNSRKTEFGTIASKVLAYKTFLDGVVTPQLSAEALAKEEDQVKRMEKLTKVLPGLLKLESAAEVIANYLTEDIRGAQTGFTTQEVQAALQDYNLIDAAYENGRQVARERLDSLRQLIAQLIPQVREKIDREKSGFDEQKNTVEEEVRDFKNRKWQIATLIETVEARMSEVKRQGNRRATTARRASSTAMDVDEEGAAMDVDGGRPQISGQFANHAEIGPKTIELGEKRNELRQVVAKQQILGQQRTAANLLTETCSNLSKALAERKAENERRQREDLDGNGAGGSSGAEQQQSASLSHFAAALSERILRMFANVTKSFLIEHRGHAGTREGFQKKLQNRLTRSESYRTGANVDQKLPSDIVIPNHEQRLMMKLLTHNAGQNRNEDVTIGVNKEQLHSLFTVGQWEKIVRRVFAYLEQKKEVMVDLQDIQKLNRRLGQYLVREIKWQKGSEYGLEECFLDICFAANPFRLSKATEMSAVAVFSKEVCKGAGGENENKLITTSLEIDADANLQNEANKDNTAGQFGLTPTELAAKKEEQKTSKSNSDRNSVPPPTNADANSLTARSRLQWVKTQNRIQFPFDRLISKFGELANFLTKDCNQDVPAGTWKKLFGSPADARDSIKLGLKHQSANWNGGEHTPETFETRLLILRELRATFTERVAMTVHDIDKLRTSDIRSRVSQQLERFAARLENSCSCNKNKLQDRAHLEEMARNTPGVQDALKQFGQDSAANSVLKAEAQTAFFVEQKVSAKGVFGSNALANVSGGAAGGLTNNNFDQTSFDGSFTSGALQTGGTSSSSTADGTNDDQPGEFCGCKDLSDKMNSSLDDDNFDDAEDTAACQYRPNKEDEQSVIKEFLQTVEPARILAKLERLFYNKKENPEVVVRIELEELFRPEAGEFFPSRVSNLYRASTAADVPRLLTDFEDDLFDPEEKDEELKEANKQTTELKVQQMLDKAELNGRGFFAVQSAWKSYRIRLLQQQFFKALLTAFTSVQIGQVFILSRFLEKDFFQRAMDKITGKFDKHNGAYRNKKKRDLSTRIERALQSTHLSMIDDSAVTAATDMGMILDRNKEDKKETLLSNFKRRVGKAAFLSTIVFSDEIWYKSLDETSNQQFRAQSMLYAGKKDENKDLQEKWVLSMLQAYGDHFDRMRMTQTEAKFMQLTHNKNLEKLNERFLNAPAGSFLKMKGSSNSKDQQELQLLSKTCSEENPCTIVLDSDLIATRDGAGVTVRELNEFWKYDVSVSTETTTGKDYHGEFAKTLDQLRAKYRLEEAYVDGVALQEMDSRNSGADRRVPVIVKARKQKSSEVKLDDQKLLISRDALIKPNSLVLRAQDGKVGVVEKIVKSSFTKGGALKDAMPAGLLKNLKTSLNSPRAESFLQEMFEKEKLDLPTLYDVSWYDDSNGTPEVQQKTVRLLRQEIVPIVDVDPAMAFAFDKKQAAGSGQQQQQNEPQIPAALLQEFTLASALTKSIDEMDTSSDADSAEHKFCQDLIQPLELPPGSRLPLAAKSYSSQRFMLKLFKLRYENSNVAGYEHLPQHKKAFIHTALHELRRQTCTHFYATLSHGIDAQDLHRHLVIGGTGSNNDKKQPQQRTTSMSEKDDALLERLQALDSPDMNIVENDRFSGPRNAETVIERSLNSLRHAQAQDMYGRLHEVGALLPLRAKFTMDYHYSSFWEDAEDRIEAMRDKVEDAITTVDPSLKRKFPKWVKYILKTLLPVVKDVWASDQTDMDLDKMIEHVLQKVKGDIGQLKLEPYLKIDDTKSVRNAMEEKAKEAGLDQDDEGKEHKKTLIKFLEKEMGLKRIFHLKSPRYILHAMLIAIFGVVQLAISFIPYLAPISEILREEGVNDIAFAIDAFMKGDCPHIKRWFKNTKLPSVCQTVFQLGLTGRVQDSDNGGGWGAFNADKPLEGLPGMNGFAGIAGGGGAGAAGAGGAAAGGGA
ncbi:unnamed protein product, partial [Amoebophrya sp. A120]